MLALALSLGSAALFAQAADPKPREPVEHLRIVGGLAGVNQYLRHEEPFWTRRFPQLAKGLVTTEIVSFDKAGLSGPELLRAVQTGAASFGTLQLSLAAAVDPELDLSDLSGLNPDFESLRRNVQAHRPRLAQMLKQKYDIELLAIYTYPAQVVYCTQPFDSLANLTGRQIRVSAGAQADFFRALGARPVQIPFAQVVPSIKAGTVDCAVTGTMSGNTIGLHEVTSHIHPMAVNWGLGVVLVQAQRWQRLQPAVRAVLERELPVLESEIWAEAQTETDEGLACNIGSPHCKSGRKGRMSLVKPQPIDQQVRLDALNRAVLPAWLQRCGPACKAPSLASASTPPELRAR